MQRISTLFQERLPMIRDSVWYRQRFDACPHFMFFLGDAHISEIQHTEYPYGQRIVYAGFSKNRADWYHSLPELASTANQIIQAAKRDPEISRKMVADFLPWQEKFYAACREMDAINLASLTNEELLATYQNLADVYTKKLDASPLIDGFALSTDTMIANQIKSVTSFSILTAPVFLSFLQEEELALNVLALNVKEHPEAQKELLQKHQRDFFWMQNNYVKDHVLDVAYFAERLKAFADVDVTPRIEELSSTPKRNKEKKEALMDEMHLPEDLRTLLRITDDFNAWQDERKKGTFWATHYFSLLLQEFSRRTDYSLEELKYAFPPEMPMVLSRSLKRKELQDRFSYCMILWVLDAYDVTTDQKFIAELDRIGTGALATDTTLRGFAASLGKARGKVKVLMSAEEINKIEEGDVLVAVMTRPDYVPAMKKAVAFITDEGGITCHAAIVSREMGKPCIIGTKIATRVLKDGDEVEVNANEGIVKVIRRKI